LAQSAQVNTVVSQAQPLADLSLVVGGGTAPVAVEPTASEIAMLVTLVQLYSSSANNAIATESGLLAA
jgi:hypothetical protein